MANDEDVIRRVLLIPPMGEGEVLSDLRSGARIIREHARPKRHGKPDWDRNTADTLERLADRLSAVLKRPEF